LRIIRRNKQKQTESYHFDLIRIATSNITKRGKPTGVGITPNKLH